MGISRLWVPSGRPLGAGEKTRAGIRCVSAGTRDASSIPAIVIDAQLDFIGSAFVDSNGQSSN